MINQFFIFIFLISISSDAFSKKRVLSTQNTKIHFSIMSFEIEKAVVGKFQKFEGHYDFNVKSLILKSMNMRIDSSSVQTNDEKQDRVIQSTPALLDSEKFPDIKVSVNMPIKLKLQKMVVVPGQLLIKGIKKPVSLLIMYLDQVGGKPRFNALLNIRRKDFQITSSNEISREKMDLLQKKFKRFKGEILGESIKVNVSVNQ